MIIIMTVVKEMIIKKEMTLQGNYFLENIFQGGSRGTIIQGKNLLFLIANSSC